MQKIINGIQQIGIGVNDAKKVFNWYRRHLGFDILVFEDNSTAHLMLRYTGGKPRDRYALLAMNMRGGGGLEIWQFKKREPKAGFNRNVQLGDLGINAMKIRSRSVKEIHTKLSVHHKPSISEINATKKEGLYFYFVDPWDNLVQVVEDDYTFCNTRNAAGGVFGTIIGVSDMEKSLSFYGNVLGYNQIISDRSGFFPGFSSIQGGSGEFRSVLLGHHNRATGGFGELLGPSKIELIQALDRKPVKIYENRLWGDLGYIHLCFDIYGMKELRKECESYGHPFTVDSSDSFDMGNAAGHFSYIEDPDGTLIEFVETHRVPILKRLGVYVNLKNRNPGKPLPKWLVKAMRLHRRSRDLK